MIAFRMHDLVHGVFEAKKGQEELIYIVRPMLDRWYKVVLSKKEDGLAEFKKILEDPDIRLNYLAQKMKAHLTIGLPAAHPELPQDLLNEPNKTASRAVVSNQSTEPVCASHSVAKAVVEIFHDQGYDSNQQKIIEALVNSHQQNRKAKNPDEFNEKRIKANIVKQDDADIKGEIEIEIKVS